MYNPKQKQTMAEGYNKFVIKSPSGCWGWSGCAPKNPGYGQFRYEMKLVRSHRASWILHFGPIPKGMSVLHTCDNRICSNPDHLFLGSQRDNMKDLLSKKKHISSKIKGTFCMKDEDIQRVRKLLKEDASPYEIARIFNVAHTTIYKVKNNKIGGAI